MDQTTDSCSSCNSEEAVVKNWDWEVDVDFKSKRLRCTATLSITTLTEGVGNLVSGQLSTRMTWAFVI